ncbi:hypothetical protein B9M85_06395 [Mycobacteroides abscessus]|nr:hypothetical protein B9M85_06395 [Mycobacteroides abscessus]PVA88648.1 hypothetical protein DDJ75_03430 [Mycobacteroides abscessus]
MRQLPTSVGGSFDRFWRTGVTTHRVGSVTKALQGPPPVQPAGGPRVLPRVGTICEVFENDSVTALLGQNA